MNLSDMTHREKSLLLYIETRAVDNYGLIDYNQVNAEEVDTLKKWAESGFIQFGRVAYRFINKKTETNWVRLSDEAFALAHQERTNRAGRMWDKRTWMSTEEYRDQI